MSCQTVETVKAVVPRLQAPKAPKRSHRPFHLQQRPKGGETPFVLLQLPMAFEVAGASTSINFTVDIDVASVRVISKARAVRPRGAGTALGGRAGNGQGHWNAEL